MAVMRLRRGHVPVLQPFLQLARPCRSRCGGRRVRSARKLRREVRIRAEHVAACDALREQVAQDLRVHRRAGAERGAERMLVLRRERWRGHQAPVRRILDQRRRGRTRRRPASTGRPCAGRPGRGRSPSGPTAVCTARRRPSATGPTARRRSARSRATGRCCGAPPSRARRTSSRAVRAPVLRQVRNHAHRAARRIRPERWSRPASSSSRC